MRNLRLDICYDGTRYRGWQRLTGNQSTIQGKIEACLSRILNEPIEIIGSGRTDAGVHAVGQVANFHTNAFLSAEEILSALRKYLPEDIGIYSCREVSPRFHARLNARAKTYRYRIWNSTNPCVFDRRFVTVSDSGLDISAMRKAAACLLGEHDFSAFCANAKMKKSTVRSIYAIKIERIGPEVQITVTGDGFLHGMVRIIAGTLIEVGRGDRDPQQIPMLFGQKREAAGFMAPPEGLSLMEVFY